MQRGVPAAVCCVPQAAALVQCIRRLQPASGSQFCLETVLSGGACVSLARHTVFAELQGGVEGRSCVKAVTVGRVWQWREAVCLALSAKHGREASLGDRPSLALRKRLSGRALFLCLLLQLVLAAVDVVRCILSIANKVLVVLRCIPGCVTCQGASTFCGQERMVMRSCGSSGRDGSAAPAQLSPEDLSVLRGDPALLCW